LRPHSPDDTSDALNSEIAEMMSDYEERNPEAYAKWMRETKERAKAKSTAASEDDA
jgi:hypothetical protein